MEALSSSAFSTSINFSNNLPITPHNPSTLSSSSSSLTLKFHNSTPNKNHLNLSYSLTSRVSNLSTKTRATSGRWREFLAGLSGTKKDYGYSRTQPTCLPNLQTGSTLLFPEGNTKGWLVRMDKPGVGVVTKAQMVDFYSQILTKVLQNEQDAQMCIYNVSWQSNFGFCCELDEECAKELAGVPGVLSVEPDENFESDNKNYGGGKNSMDQPDSSEASQRTPVKTKKLFVTGLSFYTSEKTLRAAFEGFGELVGVKIIMDKISKRSKGYAFVEYTTEEAASAALKEMNGKIINGWMIVVDAAKTTPQKPDRSRSGPRAS